VRRLIGFTRVSLDAGETAEITVRVPADVASFTGRAGTRIVEPGLLRLEFGTSSESILLSAPVTLTGPVRQVGFDRELHATLTRA
jgi:beta-xylosidase